LPEYEALKTILSCTEALLEVGVADGIVAAAGTAPAR